LRSNFQLVYAVEILHPNTGIVVRCRGAGTPYTIGSKALEMDLSFFADLKA
jgi:hypothetical protein